LKRNKQLSKRIKSFYPVKLDVINSKDNVITQIYCLQNLELDQQRQHFCSTISTQKLPLVGIFPNSIGFYHILLGVGNPYGNFNV